MYDILITLTAPVLISPVPVRELYQFHPVIIVTAKEIALETLHTSEDWHESE